MSGMGPAGFTYIRGLDGLRAFAVLAVIIGHATPFAPGGSVGVNIFFVLSGFLITSILRREHAATGRIDLRSFYIRRFLRLTPALWTLAAAYVLYAASLTLLKRGPGMWNVFESTLFALTYTMNWVRAFHLGPEGLLGHTWSLAIEEQFYLLWPLALIALLRLSETSARFAVAALAAASFLLHFWLSWRGADPFRTYNGFDTRCGELLVGCLLAFVNVRELPRGLLKAWPIPAAFLAYCVVSGGTPLGALLHAWALWSIDLAAAWCVASIVAADGGGQANFMESALLVGTGRISYGMYLWHYPVVMLIADRWSLPINFAAVLAATYALAALSYIVVELPALRLKSRFEAKALRPVAFRRQAPPESVGQTPYAKASGRMERPTQRDCGSR